MYLFIVSSGMLCKTAVGRLLNSPFVFHRRMEKSKSGA